MIKFRANLIKSLANLFRGPSYIVGFASPGEDHRRIVLERAKTATQDNAPPEPAWDLGCLFRAALNATVVHGDQPGRYNPSFPFCRLNDEELRTIATIAFRSKGFRKVTADDARTLEAITCMAQFREEDR